MIRTIADRLLSLDPIDWAGEALTRKRAAERANVGGRANEKATKVAGSRPSHALADYAGEYEHPGYGRIIIGLAAGELTATFHDDSSPLDHFHYDVFDMMSSMRGRMIPRTCCSIVASSSPWDTAGRISALNAGMEAQVPPIQFTRFGLPAERPILSAGIDGNLRAWTLLGNEDRQEVGRWINNRAENSHLPFRRRERAMQRFRRMKALQKFSSVHAQVHNHFTQERRLIDRPTKSAARPHWPSSAPSWPEGKGRAARGRDKLPLD